MTTMPNAQAQRPASDGDGVFGGTFELVARAVNAAFYVWLPASDDLQCSPALLDLFGNDHAGGARQRFWERIHGDDLNTYRAARAAYLKGAADRAEFTYRARTSGGTWRWLRDQTTVERDSAGQVTRLVGAISDVTEARQREAELAAASQALAERDAENRALTARQAASIEVLKAISASPDDTQPVFDLIARRARELCDAAAVVVIDYDGTLMRLRALEGYDRAVADPLRDAFPRPPGVETMAGRVVLSGQTGHIRDVGADPAMFSIARDLGIGTLLGVAMLRGDTVVGVVLVARRETGGFDDAQVALLQSFAEQAVIAITSTATLRELRARTAALAQRNSEYGERIDHQSATIDVLKAMSASPGDTRPVFDLIVRRAQSLCNGASVGLFEFDGTLVHARASAGGDTAAIAAFQRLFPMAPIRGSLACRAILDRQIIHVRDMSAEDGLLPAVRAMGAKSTLALPLLRDGTAIGAMALNAREPGGFSDNQVELLRTFAEQAVIAIGSAETYRELQARTAALAARNSEYGERIEQQSATIDVLQAMSASPGDARPVFALIVERARAFCGAERAMVALLDDRMLHLQAHTGMTGEVAREYAARFPRPLAADSMFGRALLARDAVQIADVQADPEHFARAKRGGAWDRSIIAVPLLRAGAPIGAIAIGRTTPGEFSATQVELLKTFAEQAVIAIGSAETFRELQERTAALAQRNDEFGERISQQSATIDVLKAMSDSPDDTRPVFDLITRRAAELCEARAGLFEFDGTLMHFRAGDGTDPETTAAFARQFPRPPDSSFVAERSMAERRVIHVRSVAADPDLAQAARDLGGSAIVAIPLLRDAEPIGAIALNGGRPGGFTDSQIALLQTFAEQAVIAIGSVVNFRALRERTAELTRSVAELQALEEVLRAVNSSLDLDTVLVTIISRAVQLSQADEGTIYEFDAAEEVFLPKAAFGMSADRIDALRDRRIRIGETPLGNSAARRAPLHIPDLTQAPDQAGAQEMVKAGIHALLVVPLLRDDAVVGGLVIRRREAGGFAPSIPTLLQTFAGQCVLAIENARLFQELTARGEEARRARAAAEATLADLRRAQDRLVQSEKMASLGQLTAGIAHEIKNPLNFVNNFSDLSVDLLDELHAAVAPDRIAIAAELRGEIDELTATLKGNLEKIAQHGRRADSIVRNMLLHSRSGPSEHRPIDLNAAVEEALNLAYHGARAETQGFNITLEKDLDPAAGAVDLYPQEFTRVMLNLIGNGFYAARNRAAGAANGGGDKNFAPTLRLATRDLGEQVEIRVHDNGTGISDAARGKIFEPFFTTKPAGEGTGLGLSLSYDIIVKQHSGQLTVDSRADAFTEFVITLPRRMPASDGDRA